MPYRICYKKNNRNWTQYSLNDFCPGLKAWNERFLDLMQEFNWTLKKAWHLKQKAAGVKKLPSLRRGRKLIPYPTKDIYMMNEPRDIAELKRFKWFTPAWICKEKCDKSITIVDESPPAQICQILPLDKWVFPHYVRSSPIPNISHQISAIPRLGRKITMEKDCFCSSMSNWAWGALHDTSKSTGFVSHLFYLNSFQFFDEPQFLDQIGWKTRDGGLPSDVIKMELHRLQQGFVHYDDFFRILELSPNILDHLAINMTHSLPSAHHIHEILKKIGLSRIQAFRKSLVQQARTLGLIKDQIHIWDGQFHATWLKNEKDRRLGLEPFFGGVYNHGGAKVGVGVQQSTIVDWNGYCAIPIYHEVVPANLNDNVLLRNAINHAYIRKEIPKIPQFFLADRGPFGFMNQNRIWRLGIQPIIPLPAHIKQDVRITANKQHHFYKHFAGQTSDEILEILYNIRTRIEEHNSLNDSIYRQARLTCTGEELTRIEIELTNTLAVLTPLTAFKIGRPDWMWSPTKFRSYAVHPEKLFPTQYLQLQKYRWDDEVCVSPKRIDAEIASFKN